ncbi:hypothetical protein BJV82DRAFT_337922 [Fennellomyces sp. T-0311]|nr:hypothetical protein BJV82DRAFT_337922 [Fennellomyces sp. T-0311]
MADHVQARLELQAFVSNQAESTRREIANNIEEAVAFELIDWQDETRVLVKSFIRGGTTYSINLEDNERGDMVDCSCPDFVQRGFACKHMHLVNIIHGVHLPAWYLTALSTPPVITEPEQNEHILHGALFGESLARVRESFQKLAEQAERVNSNTYPVIAARYINQASQNIENAWSILKTWEQNASAQLNRQNRLLFF